MTERFPDAVLTDLPDDIRQRIEDEAEKSGFVPNVFIKLARRPTEFRAFFAYYDALMDKDTGNLSKADREMIVTATSSANGCLYCVVAHGALLRLFKKRPDIADKVSVNYRHADLEPREEAMLDFAMKVCKEPADINDDDFTRLAEHGFDAEDVWDIAAITGFFGLSNRMATVSGMRPNQEFYTLGRVPKDIYQQLNG